MSWNLEVACVPIKPGVPIARVVPDVFVPNGDVGFEDATSVVRGTDLCATVLSSWAVLIDVGCRLSAAGPWLSEVSSEQDAYVFRIADEPVKLHYSRGRAQAEHRGVSACLRALGRSRLDKGDRADGEGVARELIRTQTGLAFPDDFWKCRFTVFSVE
jgi:hypothetical protein